MSALAEPVPDAFPAGVARTVASSVEELLAGASAREPLIHDGKSGAVLERVSIAGEPHGVKHLGSHGDWVARVSGDVACRPLVLWRAGIFDALPPVVDHATVGVAAGLGHHGWGAALLMRDVSEWLVPAGDHPLPLAQHRRFLHHMAALHAAFWGFEDEIGLMPLSHRYLMFGPHLWETERVLGSRAVVPELARAGWDRFRSKAPGVAPIVLELRDAPWPLVDALEGTPATLLHGDWKAGNLGSGPDGRTILLDWALPGRGPACADLAWYLAINSARVPEPLPDAIAAYRRSLAGCGVPVDGWWDRQLDLCLLGAVVQFGWDMAAHGTAENLSWWEARVEEGARWLG